MSEPATKLPVKTEEKAAADRSRHPLVGLRREVERLFDDFDRDFWLSPFRRSPFEVEPFWRRELRWAATPAIDIVEKDGAYEVTVELPGMDEKDIEVKLAGDGLVIKGEKQEAKEEKKKGYHLHERRFGSFERFFTLPEGVETDKIEASFKKGVLTITLPKAPAAQKPEKKITVKAA